MGAREEDRDVVVVDELRSQVSAARESCERWREEALAARQKLEDLRRELERAKELKRAERQGRIEAEKKLMRVRTTMTTGDDEGEGTSAFEEGMRCVPIGTMRTCFTRRSGTPRQPHLVPTAKGVLHLKPSLPKDILLGLSEYSHVWVLYIFHKNTNLHQEWERMKAKVNVPRLNGGRVGVLATRTPHRPNAIGLSSARIDRVGDKVLEVSGVDIVDGSPVLDIKPYVPFCDCIGDARTPPWVRMDRASDQEEPLHVSGVAFTEDAERRLAECWEGLRERKTRVASLYDSVGDVLSLVKQVLGRGARPLPPAP